MQRKTGIRWILALVFLVAPPCSRLVAQGPVVLPTPKKIVKPALVVECDLPCTWKLDGVEKGHLQPGQTGRVSLDKQGPHKVAAFTEDGADQIAQDISSIKNGETLTLDLHLGPIRLKRLEAELKQQQSNKTEDVKKTQDDTARKTASDQAAAWNRQGAQFRNQQRYTEALPFFERACNAGNVDGCKNLGLLYKAGWGVTRDYAHARGLLRKACEAGNDEACSNLGEMFAATNQGGQDFGVAKTLYERSCENGYVQGCAGLGDLYVLGAGVSVDYRQAGGLYTRACKSGYMDGCARVAGMYLNGLGVKKDEVQAGAIDQKACEGGSLMACNDLAEIYEHGRGVQQNYAQAVSLYEKACTNGYMPSCISLGQIEEAGRGVAKNKHYAHMLFQKACDAGLTDACAQASKTPAR